MPTQLIGLFSEAISYPFYSFLIVFQSRNG